MVTPQTVAQRDHLITALVRERDDNIRRVEAATNVIHGYFDRIDTRPFRGVRDEAQRRVDAAVAELQRLGFTR